MKRLAEVKILAAAENLPAAMDCARGAARDAGLGARLGDVELVVEEFFTNACKYGGPAGSVDFELACLTDETGFVVELRDSGRPFDPTRHLDPDVKAPIEERPLGGLGVFLAKKVSDGIEYRREDGRNILRVRFRR